MSLLRDLVLPRADASASFLEASSIDNPALWLGDSFSGRRTASGEQVSHQSSMQVAAYFACIRNLSEDLAKLPLQLRRRLEPRGSEVVRDHPIHKLLHSCPNPSMGAFQFRRTLLHHALGWGNGYAEIVRDHADKPIALWPVHPSRVKPRVLDSGEVVYDWRANGNTPPKTLPAREVLHIRGLGDGVEGYSVLRFQAESLGLAIAAQRFGGAFFGEGLAKRLVAVVKQKLSPKGRRGLRKRLRGDQRNDVVGARKLPILEGDVSVHEAGVNPTDAQYLETREFGIEEIARWFRMQLAKIQYSKRAQGWSTLEALNTDYVNDALMPWAVCFEEEADLKLLDEGEREDHYVKHVFQGLMRGDIETRRKWYESGRKNGWLSINDILDLEDRDLVDDARADEYNFQLPTGNPAPAAKAGESDDDEPEDEPEDGESPDEEATARERFRVGAVGLSAAVGHVADGVCGRIAGRLRRSLKARDAGAAAFDAWAADCLAEARSRAQIEFSATIAGLSAIADACGLASFGLDRVLSAVSAALDRCFFVDAGAPSTQFTQVAEQSATCLAEKVYQAAVAAALENQDA